MFLPPFPWHYFCFLVSFSALMTLKSKISSSLTSSPCSCTSISSPLFVSSSHDVPRWFSCLWGVSSPSEQDTRRWSSNGSLCFPFSQLFPPSSQGVCWRSSEISIVRSPSLVLRFPSFVLITSLAQFFAWEISTSCVWSHYVIRTLTWSLAASTLSLKNESRGCCHCVAPFVKLK